MRWRAGTRRACSRQQSEKVLWDRFGYDIMGSAACMFGVSAWVEFGRLMSVSAAFDEQSRFHRRAKILNLTCTSACCAG